MRRQRAPITVYTVGWSAVEEIATGHGIAMVAPGESAKYIQSIYIRKLPLRTRIAKWGNSLALRIPKAFVAEAGLEDGAPVDITVSGGQIVVTPLGREYNLADLVDDITDTNRHTETDWGRPVGSEVW